jgi:site-specific DNA recombinase
VPDKRIVPAVLYAAKSTEDKRGSIPDQLAKGRAFCEHEDWTLFDEFEDEGLSAYSGNRGPDLEKAKAKAIALAEKYGTCNFVALHSDRVARGAGDAPGAADHLVEVVAFLRRNGVTLRTVEDDLYSDSRVGLLMAAVMGQRNTEDSRRKSEAVRAGMQRRAERGQFSGPRPYGYKYAADGSGLVPLDSEAQIVRRIFTEYVGGRSLSDIALGLHHDKVRTQKGSLWRQSTVSGIVRNPVYIGMVTFRGKTVPGAHAGITDTELWERAAQLLAAKPSKRGRPPKMKRHLFTGGFLRCGACGEAMIPRTRPESGYEFYECNGRKLHNCRTGAIRRVDIDKAVLAHFEQTSLDLEATRELFVSNAKRELSESRALLDAAEREAGKAVARLEKVRRDYTHGELTAAEWRELRGELQPEASAAQAEVERWKERVAAAESQATLGDAEATVLEQLTELRAAVAGEVARHDEVEAVRAALVRLFDRFVLHTDIPAEAHVELIDGGYWIEPVISEQSAMDLGEKFGLPQSREPLAKAENKYAEGLPSR